MNGLWSIYPSQSVLAVSRGSGFPRPAEPRRPSRRAGKLAIVELVGVVAHRPGGDVSTEAVGQLLNELLADASVSGIILDVDSPGGPLPGVSELAEKIFRSRGKKPLAAVVNSLAAGAAYWIAAAADTISITPSGQTGGLGVVALHVDRSGADAKAGLRYEIIASDARKAELWPHRPLGGKARAELQRKVNRWAAMFDEAVAKFRNVPLGIVQTMFGRGRIYEAPEAVRRGLVDEVATLDEVIARMADCRRLSSVSAAGRGWPGHDWTSCNESSRESTNKEPSDEKEIEQTARQKGRGEKAAPGTREKNTAQPPADRKAVASGSGRSDRTAVAAAAPLPIDHLRVTTGRPAVPAT